jgi:hypothetical protein
MYDYWQQETVKQHAFRDPLTRKIITYEEKKKIVALTGKPWLSRFVANTFQATLVFDELSTWNKPGENWVKVSVSVVDTERSYNLTGMYFLLLVYFPDDAMRQQLIRALREFLEFVNVDFDLDKKIINHGAVHFNNFRERWRWLIPNTEDANPETLVDLQQELLPFISFDWSKDILEGYSPESPSYSPTRPSSSPERII